ncbi:CocE/NonD family hydrolase [Thermoflavimicrobium daqui]|uniref:Hydrolase n=1 Tax=Thermoflavimicrobium daqui TaxID=2137476 RepID=A0A364K4F3_9BACL|nr:CocE/NonD family hydrolase [Thermoflavimicrobium daqui]RAL24217.1 hydrolase [Thermoflavimicrobium daqui]
MDKHIYKEFSYYKNGIHLADIRITSQEIYHRKKSIETNEWSSYESLPSDHGYDMVTSDFRFRLAELNQMNWTNEEEVKVSWGDRYQRYLRMDGKVEGEEQVAWIWALQEVKFPTDLIISDNEVIGWIYNGNPNSVLVKKGYEDLTILKQWNDPHLSKPLYGIKYLGRQDVITRDGIKLATDVYLPSGLPDGEKVPTILVRTPYGRQADAPKRLSFVQRGYALVIQDTRGREDSEGEWIPLIYEMEDGDDTLNWIATQPWSNGKVGMIGGSYLGFVQWAAAASGNPHLKAIVSQVTAGTPFVDFPRPEGAISSGMLAWSFMMAERKKNDDAMKRDDWDEVLKTRPLKDIPLKALGKELKFWNEWMNHSDYDAFWEKANWAKRGNQINVPSLLISGWYDDDGMGTSEAWEMNRENNREHTRMILGPWYHSFNTTRQIHQIPFGNQAIRYDLNQLELRWFDHFLKDIPNDVEKEARVEYYMVGENEWKTSEDWPPPDVVYTPFYLHSKGNANTSQGDGSVDSIFPQQEKSDTYRFDPEDPTPFLIDMSENECRVPENYRDVELRQDVLVYTSEPLQEDITIAGDIYAVLYAASSAKDTDWLVRLTDVDEEGNSICLSDGLVRARYRNSVEKPELLKPGKVEKYEIRMTKIANVFKKGHRIRISVTSGAKNSIFPNHNTGNNPMTDTEMVVATQTIYHDEKYPSHVRLPILNKTHH